MILYDLYCWKYEQNGMNGMNCYILSHFQLLAMFNTIVGAGAASCYGSGSDQMMWLLAAPAPAPQHCIFWIKKIF
jgi:hypothetical protein